jgi:hypothetical protein
LEEEDLPFPSHYQPLPNATNPNATVHNGNQQTSQTPNSKSNSKQASSKNLLRVFFLFCTVSINTD